MSKIQDSLQLTFNMAFPIDEIINELSIKDNGLVIFCGAGISINSGLPAAIPLIDEVLNQLEIDTSDKLQLIHPDWSLAMPFEMFIEIFLGNTDEHQILEIFNDGSPSTNHFFISKCHSVKILNEVYTTNFDLLIEQAFNVNKKGILTFKTEESFSSIEFSTEKCKLIKIHGSIDDIESIRTTLSTITKKSLTQEREKVINRIFSEAGSNKRILILGYSCSDIFDIVPRIEKIYNPQVRIYFIEHCRLINKKEEVIIEEILQKEENNPFKKYKGKRIKVNTDSFVKWFWKTIDKDYAYISQINDNWKIHINNWIKGFHSEYLKATIIGQLFFRVSNFDLALKYHQRALTINNGKSKRGEGASYSNIGLIYHSKKEYDKAIENFKKASTIFNDIENFFFGQAAAYTNLGYTYIYKYNKIQAIINLKKSLLLSRREDFREKRLCEADALSCLGLLYEKQGNLNDSLYYYSLTLEIDKEGNKSGEAQTLSDMARVYRLSGRLKKSLQLFKAANEIARKLGMQTLISYTQEQIEEILLKPDK